MASFNIHLAVGKRYFEKNDIKDEELFIKGLIDPDLVEDKIKSHYSLQMTDNSLLGQLAAKVSLPQFLKENTIDDSYQKGIFLHLITDYLFFNNFFEEEYIKQVDDEQFSQNLYYSYDITNPYLQKKYHVDCSYLKEHMNKNSEKKENDMNSQYINILSIKKLDMFIEKVSNINLEDYRDNILEVGNNIII